jgi:predicted flap endonuclease-1-like 5' DNA nuclease
MMDQLTNPRPLFAGAPEFLTLPFVLIGAGVVVLILLMMWGSARAASRRRLERELEQIDEATGIEAETPDARPITPPPPAPEAFDEVLPPSPPAPEPDAEPELAAAAPEPEPAVEEVEEVDEVSEPAPEPEPAAEAAPEAEPEPEPEPEPAPAAIEGAPVREPEPEPLEEAPSAEAAPLDAGPAGVEEAVNEPVVAPARAEEPEPASDAEPAESAAPTYVPVGEAPLPVVEPAAEAAEPASAEAPVEAVAAAAPVSAAPDDLTRMKGVGPRLAERLNSVGVASFAQIAALSPEAAAELDSKLGDFQGRLERDRWIEQAGLLASGDIAAYEEKFGKL